MNDSIRIENPRQELLFFCLLTEYSRAHRPHRLLPALHASKQALTHDPLSCIFSFLQYPRLACAKSSENTISLLAWRVAYMNFFLHDSDSRPTTTPRVCNFPR